MNQLFSRLVPAVLVVLAAVQSAHASIIVYAYESGGNVVFKGGGTVDVTDLTLRGNATASSNLRSNSGLFFFSGSNGNYGSYVGVSGSVFFGNGTTSISANSISGNPFGISGSSHELRVPVAYVSGAKLKGSMTFNNQTLASLSLTPGTYVWTWGSGDHADSVTLNIGVSPVPEPGTLASFAAVGLLGLLPLRRRRNQQLHNA